MSTYADQSIDINELVDIRHIQIDESLPVSEKKQAYKDKIKNPACFRHGDTIVRVSYAQSGPTMKELLQQYLLSGQHTELTAAI